MSYTSKSLNFKGIKLLEIKVKTVLEKWKIHFSEHMACCSDILVEVHCNLVAITCLLERVVTSRDGLPWQMDQKAASFSFTNARISAAFTRRPFTRHPCAWQRRFLLSSPALFFFGCFSWDESSSISSGLSDGDGDGSENLSSEEFNASSSLNSLPSTPLGSRRNSSAMVSWKKKKVCPTACDNFMAPFLFF